MSYTETITSSNFEADIQTITDFYPYGMPMPKRYRELAAYRYGMNGMEEDNELKGNGNHYSSFYRQLDPRIGRWFSIDPVTHAFQSPYNSFDNNPIWNADPMGDDVEPGSFATRIHLLIGQVFSKEFRIELNKLKESDNLYTFNLNSEGKSKVRLTWTNEDLDGHMINQEFTIDYSLSKTFKLDGKPIKSTSAPYGLSPFHSLFEETFHATDHLTGGKSGIVINNANELGWQTNSGKIYGESLAVKFAADNAPFSTRFGYYNAPIFNGIHRVRSETIINKIKNSPQDRVGSLLFSPVEINIDSYVPLVKDPKISVGPMYKLK